MTQIQKPINSLVDKIQFNCDISDARDHGIYSICILVLRLRGLYKWENGIDPWDEPETADVLDWIDTRENYWQTLLDKEFVPIELNGNRYDPFDVEEVNKLLYSDNIYYGAGFGQSMKSIFFLGSILEERQVNGCRVVILGQESARELAGPFAMRQGSDIIIRREQLKHFLGGQLQEILPSAKEVMSKVLAKYSNNSRSCHLEKETLKHHLSTIVDQEIPIFIHHEIGEMQETPLDRKVFQTIVSDFPDSLIEFLCRAVKDILADTHPDGMLGFIIGEKRELSLGFYLSFLNGIRRTLFPEIAGAIENFILHGNSGWDEIEEVREIAWENNFNRAETIAQIVLESQGKNQIKNRIEKKLLEPLGLGPDFS